MKRGCVIHVQGSKDLEKLYCETVDTEGGGGFTALKQGAGPLLAREVALFLGYGWPSLLQGGESREDLEPHERNRLDIVEEFTDNITKPRLIVNVYAKIVKADNGGKTRTAECFALQLDFGARMLLVKQALQDGLTAILRERSGAPVWEDGYIDRTIGIQTVQRPGIKSEAAGAVGAAAAVDGDGPAEEAASVGAGGSAGAAEAGGAGGTATPPGADGISGEEMVDDGPTKWLLLTIPPLDLGLSRRGKAQGKSRGGGGGQGHGKGRRPAPGAVAKAPPVPPPSVVAPLGPAKAGAKGSKGGKGPKGGKGKSKDKGKGKGKGQTKAAGGRRPAKGT